MIFFPYMRMSAAALVPLLLTLAASSLHAQRILSPGDAANARTAARYMELADESLEKGDWKRASDRAAAGLGYDDTISDLWYIRAYAEQQRASPPYIVIPFVRAAMEADRWIAQHFDAARILYAQLLAETGEPQKALAALDAAPVLKGLDADFIRTQSLYRIGTAASREQGRALAQTVLRTAPMSLWKEQFILLFFRWEILPAYDTTPFLRNIARDYVADVFESDTRNADLVIHAAAFAQGDDRIRILQWFAAAGLHHPLYALFALDDAILTPAESLDYFTDAIQRAGQVDIALLETFGTRFAAAIDGNGTGDVTDAGDVNATNAGDAQTAEPVTRTPEPVPLNPEPVTRDLIAEFAAFLAGFHYTLTADTDRDGIVDMRCEYEYGRPARIYYDANQDGFDTWAVFCDLGAPRDAFFPPLNTRVLWGAYPSVARVTIGGDPEYSFGRNSLDWSPLHIYFSEALYDSPGQFLFYVPLLNPLATALTERQLLSNAATIRTKVTPTPNLRANETLEALFTLENGRVTVADYYPAPAQSGVNPAGRTGVYARAVFENGIPLRRQVDVDGDGIFEREETFTFDPGAALRVNTPQESAALYKELFGSIPYAPGLFLSKVTLDTDGDTIPDFTEEYRENGGRISRWHGEDRLTEFTTAANNGGNAAAAGTVKETLFRYARDQTVTIRFENDSPVTLTKDGITYPVTRITGDGAGGGSGERNFYWIGSGALSLADQRRFIAALASLPANTVSLIDFDGENRTQRIFLAAIGDYRFGETLDE